MAGKGTVAGKGHAKKKDFIFPTFHFRFPDFSLPFSRLFTSVFPTFYFRFPDFSLPEVKSREDGSKKSGKRTGKVGKMKKNVF